MNVFIIGIGLIGGSMALDIREQFSDAVFFGIDSNYDHLQEAIDLQIVDKKATIDDLSKADLVILSTPVGVAMQILPEILNKISQNSLVLDVGSTKFPICEMVSTHKNRSNFLAMHPIAGTEFSGPSAATKGLFQGKTNIICEVERTSFKLQEKALNVFHKMGMRIRYMDPKSHDKHIAYMSHLSHISSFMLGKTVIEVEKNERDIFDMAGSGFESTVRLAKSSPAMWTPIFEQNKENVIQSLEEYIENLTKFKVLLEQNDFDAVFDEMKNTNRIKEILE